MCQHWTEVDYWRIIVLYLNQQASFNFFILFSLWFWQSWRLDFGLTSSLASAAWWGLVELCSWVTFSDLLTDSNCFNRVISGRLAGNNSLILLTGGKLFCILWVSIWTTSEDLQDSQNSISHGVLERSSCKKWWKFIYVHWLSHLRYVDQIIY